MSAPRSSRNKKKISFGIGTAPPRIVRIAISISRHETVEQIGVTTYFIDILHSGRVTVVKRRYKDFEILNKTLVIEVGHMGYALPPLPQKRWFQTQRWLNRYDAAYIDDRRYGLEVYLRGLLRLPGLIDNCPSLRNFLNITTLAPEDPYVLERDAFDAIKYEHTYMYEAEPEEGEDWPPLNRNRFSNLTNGMGTGVAARIVNEVGDMKKLGSDTQAAVTSPPDRTNHVDQSAQADSDDSDQEFDSDDDKEFKEASVTPKQERSKVSQSKFSSVFIDGRERSGSGSGNSPFGLAGAGSPPLSSSPALKSLVTNGSFISNSNSVQPDYDNEEKEFQTEFDEPSQPEDPNDVWSMSINSAVNAGALDASALSPPPPQKLDSNGESASSSGAVAPPLVP